MAAGWDTSTFKNPVLYTSMSTGYSLSPTMNAPSHLVRSRQVILAGLIFSLALVAWRSMAIHESEQFFSLFFQWGGVSLAFSLLIAMLAYPSAQHRALLWIPLGTSFHFVGITLGKLHVPMSVVLLAMPPIQTVLIGLLIFQIFSASKLIKPVLISLFFSATYILVSGFYDKPLFFLIFLWLGVALSVESMIRSCTQNRRQAPVEIKLTRE